jgi:hypothetical protein
LPLSAEFFISASHLPDTRLPHIGNTLVANNIQQNFAFKDFPQRFIKKASDVIAFDTPQP